MTNRNLLFIISYSFFLLFYIRLHYRNIKGHSWFEVFGCFLEVDDVRWCDNLDTSQLCLRHFTSFTKTETEIYNFIDKYYMTLMSHQRLKTAFFFAVCNLSIYSVNACMCIGVGVGGSRHVLDTGNNRNSYFIHSLAEILVWKAAKPVSCAKCSKYLMFFYIFIVNI